MRRFVTLAAFAVFAASAAQAQVSSDPKQAAAGAYTMETKHTQVEFSLLHMGLTDFHGRFDKLSGTLTFDPAAPEKSAVTATIDTSSVNTPVEALNKEIVDKPVFDAAEFPTATFKSTSLKRTGANTGTMTGDMTIRGITKPVTLDVTFNGSASMVGRPAAVGFHATGAIKRSDFGMTSMMWTKYVGDDVKLTIEAMFVQAKP